ncbi:hypothetical protein ACFQH6_03495 [Halobacteriaceae archaeon GCM10025711]
MSNKELIVRFARYAAAEELDYSTDEIVELDDEELLSNVFDDYQDG